MITDNSQDEYLSREGDNSHKSQQRKIPTKPQFKKK